MGSKIRGQLMYTSMVKQKVNYFKILSLVEWSDHCQSVTELSIKTRHHNKNCKKMKQQQVKTKYKWEPISGLRIQNYVKSIKEFNKLTTTLRSKLSSAHSTLDEKVAAVTEQLTTVSDKCLKTVNKNRKRQNNENNYFDSDCYKKRKELQRLAKLMSSKPNNIPNDIHIGNSFYQTKRT